MSGYDKFDPLFGPDSAADTSPVWSYPWPGFLMSRYDSSAGCAGTPPSAPDGITYCGSPDCPSAWGQWCPEAPHYPPGFNPSGHPSGGGSSGGGSSGPSYHPPGFNPSVRPSDPGYHPPGFNPSGRHPSGGGSSGPSYHPGGGSGGSGGYRPRYALKKARFQAVPPATARARAAEVAKKAAGANGDTDSDDGGLFDQGAFRLAGTTFSAQGHDLHPQGPTHYRGHLLGGAGEAAQTWDCGH